MTFLSLFLLFLKGSLLLIIEYIPGYISRCFIGLLFIFIYCYTFRKKVIVEAIRLEDYKIIHPIVTCLTIIFIVYIVLLNLFLFKLLNIGSSVDLKILYHYIVDIIKSTSYLLLFSNGILLIGLILFGFLLLHYIRAFILKQFIMLHIYLSQYNIDWCLRNQYHLHNSYGKFTYVFCLYDYYFTFLLTKYLDPYFHMEDKYRPKNYYKNIRKLKFIERHLALIILFVSIIYDSICNNYVLTKIYYLFPITFLYMIWRMIIDFYKKRTDHVDVILSTIFYYKIIGISTDRREIVVQYEEGLTISEEDMIEAREYILNKCILKFNLNSAYKVIDQFEEFRKNNKDIENSNK